MFKKAFGFSAADVAENGTFDGYASTTLGEPDSYGDVVMPGAFTKTLARHKAKNSMPMMFFGHNADELPIGDWLEMEEDDNGLKAKGQVALDDPLGARVYSALKAGRVRGLSIGYRIPAGGIEPDPDRKGVFLLKEVDLLEVSVVNIPANPDAQVASVKAAQMLHRIKATLAAGERLTEREFETWLKGLGFSNSQAERAARVHLKGQGEPAEAENDGLAFLRALTA